MYESGYKTPAYASQSWRSFGMDTEAGRMLNKLYAGTFQKPNIQYPTLKKRTGAAKPRPRFIPGGGKVNSDPRKPSSRKVKVAFEERKKIVERNHGDSVQDVQIQFQHAEEEFMLQAFTSQCLAKRDLLKPAHSAVLSNRKYNLLEEYQKGKLNALKSLDRRKRLIFLALDFECKLQKVINEVAAKDVPCNN